MDSGVSLNLPLHCGYSQTDLLNVCHKILCWHWLASWFLVAFVALARQGGLLNTASAGV